MSITEIIRKGFNEGEPAKYAVHLADLMKRNTSLAGSKLPLWCAEGLYKVTYDENGYATKAVRI